MRELVCSSASCRAKLRVPPDWNLSHEGVRAFITRQSRWTWHRDAEGELRPLCGRCSRDA